ncbi:MAG: hypothetical protein MJ172_01095 [Clostridia bacterium]|nr:hypothetical protein [Clostridia bacterium]
MRITKALTSFVLCLLLVLNLCACGNGVKPMERLDTVSINVSASNAARGYLQAVLEEDEALFEKCFPDGVYRDYLGIEYFEKLSSFVSEAGYKFLGTRSGSVRALDEEYGELYKDFRVDIADSHNIDVNNISDIQVVNTKTYLEVEGRNYSNDCYVIVYKYNDMWFAFNITTLEDIK